MHQNLVHATIRVGIDLKLFDILCEARGPLTTKQLAEATGAAPVFLGSFIKPPKECTISVTDGH